MRVNFACFIILCSAAIAAGKLNSPAVRDSADEAVFRAAEGSYGGGWQGGGKSSKGGKGRGEKDSKGAKSGRNGIHPGPQCQVTKETEMALREAAEALPPDDDQDFKDANEGLLLRQDLTITNPVTGKVVWNSSDYDFVQGDEAPASVSQSLWRQARLNNLQGVYEVVKDKIYQVRGYDLSNLSVIVGDSGWILVDVLSTSETAVAALQLLWAVLGKEKPIKSIVLTHSHPDHYSGILGILSVIPPIQAAALRIVAPAGFTEEVANDIQTATILFRRTAYYQGSTLEKSPCGFVDSGLGKDIPSGGFAGIFKPTDLVDTTGMSMDIDGVNFVFQYVPDSEAPAEFTFYLPDWEALCGAELVSHTMHNVFTPRAAKIRDALLWSSYIDEAIDIFGGAKVLFMSHHWPIWDNDRIIDFLDTQRDTYKYIHDQTLRLANQGLVPNEISEVLKLPSSLQTSYSNRGYYGTLSHNAKGVYQRYIGWWDGNPANLNPLPPIEEATRYVAAMGGKNAVLKMARQAFEDGDYRWAATVLNHLVFAHPNNRNARKLLSRTYEQLGYLAESASWRNIYLTGACELRGDCPRETLSYNITGTVAQLPTASLLQVWATRVNPTVAGPLSIVVVLNILSSTLQLDESFALFLKNAVLRPKENSGVFADATLTLPKRVFLLLLSGQVGFNDVIGLPGVNFTNPLVLQQFFSVFDGRPSNDYPVVTP